MADEKIKTRWLLMNNKTLAVMFFDTFHEAMLNLGQQPGEWRAWWSARCIGKGDYVLEQLGEKCESPQEKPSTTPPSKSSPPGTS